MSTTARDALKGIGPTPVLLSLLAVAAGALVLVDAQTPVRTPLVFGFMAFAPGWALLDWCRFTRGWLSAAVAVAASVSMATVIATAQLYTRVWSPTVTVLILVLITLTAAALSVRRSRDEADGTDPGAPS